MASLWMVLKNLVNPTQPLVGQIPLVNDFQLKLKVVPYFVARSAWYGPHN